MHNILSFKNESHFNLRQIAQFPRHLVNSAYHGTEISSNICAKVKDILPNKYKSIIFVFISKFL